MQAAAWRVQRRLVPGWVISVTGLLLTALAVLHVVQAPTVYWSQTDVVFLTPAAANRQNTLAVTQTDAIAMAGVIQRQVVGRAVARVASDDVSIVGQGLREGTWVRLVNSGGQWTNNFDQAVLDVQVVDRTAEAARARRNVAVEAISTALEQRQVAAGVSPDRRYSVLRSPSDPSVLAERGRPTTAVLVTLLIGALGTVGARSLIHRRPQRPVSPAASG